MDEWIRFGMSVVLGVVILVSFILWVYYLAKAYFHDTSVSKLQKMYGREKKKKVVTVPLIVWGCVNFAVVVIYVLCL